MIRTLRLRPALLALTLALSACAATPSGPVAPAADPNSPDFVPPEIAGYLAASDLDGAALVGPPPAPDSPEGLADAQRFEATRALQGTARWAKATADADLWGGRALKGYACAAGLALGHEATPVTARMLERVEQDVRTIGTPAKDHYGRLRPMIGNDKPICVERAPWMEINSSYPSGHSMTGWAWALVLSELFPSKADALMAAGREMGESRVICGVHYASDVRAGRDLAAAMVSVMRSKPEFRADLEAARKELATPRPPPADCGA